LSEEPHYRGPKTLGSPQPNADPVEFLKVIAGVVGESAAFERILRCEFRKGQKLRAKAEK
jgi:hypothetical protein